MAEANDCCMCERGGWVEKCEGHIPSLRTMALPTASKLNICMSVAAVGYQSNAKSSNL